MASVKTYEGAINIGDLHEQVILAHVDAQTKRSLLCIVEHATRSDYQSLSFQDDLMKGERFFSEGLTFTGCVLELHIKLVGQLTTTYEIRDTEAETHASVGLCQLPVNLRRYPW